MASSKEELYFFHGNRKIRTILVVEGPDEKAVCGLCGLPVHGSPFYVTEPPDQLHVHEKCAKDCISPFLSHRSPRDPPSSSPSPYHPYPFSYPSSSSASPYHPYPSSPSPYHPYPFSYPSSSSPLPYHPYPFSYPSSTPPSYHLYPFSYPSSSSSSPYHPYPFSQSHPLLYPHPPPPSPAPSQHPSNQPSTTSGRPSGWLFASSALLVPFLQALFGFISSNS